MYAMTSYGPPHTSPMHLVYFSFARSIGTHLLLTSQFIVTHLWTAWVSGTRNIVRAFTRPCPLGCHVTLYSTTKRYVYYQHSIMQLTVPSHRVALLYTLTTPTLSTFSTL